MRTWAFLMDQLVKSLPAKQETWVRSLGLEGPLEKGIATHSSILSWRIPRSLVGYSSWDCEKSDATKRFSLTYTNFEAKAMATHSSTLAWKIPWTKEPGRLQSMGSQSQTRLSNFTFTFHFHDWRRKWQPTPVFLPGESQGRRSQVGSQLWGCRVGYD